LTKIKICGLTRHCDIDAVNIHKPEYVGFVFAPQSRRFISPEHALNLRRRLDSTIIPVGVFVNERVENIMHIINSGIIDVIQLHGDEDENYIRHLKTLTDNAIIKAVPAQNFLHRHSNTLADYLLFDNPTPGSGQQFDWNLIPSTPTPYFLAGGLNPDNIAEAIKKCLPFAIDTSSGVETNGLKDATKIEALIKTARNTTTTKERQ
jgi:phosphoribosylanthranilate isomerase